MLTTAVLLLLVLIPIGDAIATGFFFLLFLRSKKKGVLPNSASTEVKRRPRLWGGPALLGGRSWLLGMMTLAWATITVVFVLIGLEAGSRLTGHPPRPLLGALPTALGIIVLGTIPIAFAIVFYLTRRRRGGAPPPFGDSD